MQGADHDVLHQPLVLGPSGQALVTSISTSNCSPMFAGTLPGRRNSARMVRKDVRKLPVASGGCRYRLFPGVCPDQQIESQFPGLTSYSLPPPGLTAVEHCFAPGLTQPGMLPGGGLPSVPDDRRKAIEQGPLQFANRVRHTMDSRREPGR